MKCKNSGCTEDGKFEGYCRFCIGQAWRPCKVDGCDQYTINESRVCSVCASLKDQISVKEAAKILGVSTKTVQRLESEKILRCMRTEGGHRRFMKEDILRYMEGTHAQHPNPSGSGGRDDT